MKNLRDTLALPIVLLVVVIAAAGAAIKLTDDQARAAQSRLTAQQKQLKDADRKSTRLNSSHVSESRMPSSA